MNINKFAKTYAKIMIVVCIVMIVVLTVRAAAMTITQGQPFDWATIGVVAASLGVTAITGLRRS